MDRFIYVSSCSFLTNYVEKKPHNHKDKTPSLHFYHFSLIFCAFTEMDKFLIESIK